MVRRSPFFDLKTITVRRNRSTPAQVKPRISPMRIPVWIANNMRSCNQGAAIGRSRISSSPVNQRTRVLFSRSIETRHTGLSVHHSHSRRGRFHPIGIALILISHNPLGAHMIQRWVAEECLESPHARHFPRVVPTSCGMLLDIPVQQFREGSLLLCRFLKESSFDDLDLDLPKNGLSHPFISCPGRSPDLLPLVHKRHPPRRTSLHESHPFTPFQWDSVLWFPRGRQYRPRVLRLQSPRLHPDETDESMEESLLGGLAQMNAARRQWRPVRTGSGHESCGREPCLAQPRDRA